MYYNTEYKKDAINKLIPYLLNFPQITKITEINAERYQAIEDILWDIANNLKVNNYNCLFSLLIIYTASCMYTNSATKVLLYFGIKKQ